MHLFFRAFIVIFSVVIASPCFSQDAKTNAAQNLDYSLVGQSGYANQLNLTDQQRADIANLLDERLQGLVSSEPSERKNIIKKSNESIAALLSDEQRQVFATLLTSGSLQFSRLKPGLSAQRRPQMQHCKSFSSSDEAMRKWVLAGDQVQLDAEGKQQSLEYWAAAAHTAMTDYDAAKEQHIVSLQVADMELKAVMEADDQVAPPVRYGAAVEAKAGTAGPAINRNGHVCFHRNSNCCY